MTERFAEALEAGDLAAVRRAAKVDLHAHAYFSARIASVERWLGGALKRPPSKMAGLQGMLAYAATALDPYLDNREGAEFSARTAVEEALEDGVVRLEMSFDIQGAARYSDGLSGLSHFIRGVVEQFAPRIQLRPAVGIRRQAVSKRGLMEATADAVTCGVFDSIDLYGDENACPPAAVRPLYQLARSRGLALKAHVGEFGGPEEVRRTVEILGLDEVQHGIAAANSPAVMRWLADNGIRLNICPTSNVMLSAVADLRSHPIRRLHDHGVPVTVNTDDLTIFDQSVSEEYLNLFKSGVFTAGELDDIRRNSLLARSA